MVFVNLFKVRKKGARILSILVRKGSYMSITGKFYTLVVNSVLLLGS